MFEITYATARLARVAADDRETAKRRFAAYVLYDDTTHVESDVEVGFGDDAELAPDDGPPPVAGDREDVRTWLARHDAGTEAFEPALFEAPDRRLDAYLRVLAANDPWRLEGHGSLGRVLSAEPLVARVTTFDDRVRYTFEATQFVDYLRADVARAIDPARPEESVRVENLLDVSALRDLGLRQILSSYDSIARELALTRRFAEAERDAATYRVAFDAESWRRYVAHRSAEPARFAPPAGWRPAFPGFAAE